MGIRRPPSGRARLKLTAAIALLAATSLTAAAVLEPAPRPPSAADLAGDGSRLGGALSGIAAGGGVPSSAEAPPAAATDPPAPASRGSSSPRAQRPGPPSAGTVRRPPPRPNRASQPGPAPAPDPAAESHARYEGDVPDPALLWAGGSYWAFGTQSGLMQIQVLSSADLASWEHRGDALGRLPAWAEWGWAWAPAVLARPGGYVLYYTTRHAATGLQCISRGSSVVPQGPYLDSSTEPLVCQQERGGSIDPQPFVDVDGAVWLLWKSEGTLDGEPTRIWVQRLTADGLRVEGAAVELLATALDWEQPIIEGPAMVHLEGRYHLLYAGNRWETSAYAIGHASCASVTGPCERTGDGPLMESAGPELGPGSPAPIVTATGELVLGYHAWTAPSVGYPEGLRGLHLAGLAAAGDRLVVTRPWSGPLR